MTEIKNNTKQIEINDEHKYPNYTVRCQYLFSVVGRTQEIIKKMQDLNNEINTASKTPGASSGSPTWIQT